MTTIFGSISAFEDTRPLQPLAVRAPSPDEALRRSLDNAAYKMRVAMPAQVVSWNPEQQTVVAQPLIREKIIDRTTGSIQWVQLPQLLDVPVCFPQAGNFVLTMPITVGDEVLLVFNDMSLDAWWSLGGQQNWIDRRRHDLSDAIAVVGINNTQRVIQNILADGTELRSKDGNTKVTVQGTQLTLTVGSENIVIDSSHITLNATNIVLNGTVAINGNTTITGTSTNVNSTFIHNGNNLVHHVHPVTTAPGTTGVMTEVP